VSYDTLEHRHDKRMRRRLRILASVILSVPILFGGIFTFLWFNTQHQVDVALQKAQLSKDLLADMIDQYPKLFKDIPQAGPVVDNILIKSLGALRLGDSEYIKLLKMDALLSPRADDEMETALTKAMILRYVGQTEKAVKAYAEAAKLLPQGQEDYKTMSRYFVEQTDVTVYGCGVLIQDIDSKVSQECDGLSKNDIIVAAKGFRFRSLEQFKLTLSDNSQDQDMAFEVLRLKNGKLNKLSLKFKPGSFKCVTAEM
ncbi:MAG: hypothetical protein N2376_07030, partial [Clostridia bacterium]|nr:hypothetical protein [Clostridia bacterium]